MSTKFKIENTGGRDLGTYEGETAEEAATAFAFAGGYAGIAEAEKARFFTMDRLVFTKQEE
jgi:hypothetical protein